jgi:hypothetical protein
MKLRRRHQGAEKEIKSHTTAVQNSSRRELARANDAAWQAESANRRAEVEALRQQLQALARAAAAAGGGVSGAAAAAPASSEEEEEAAGDSEMEEAGGPGQTAPPAAAAAAAAAAVGSSSAPALDWEALDRVFDRAARGDARGEVPSAFSCPLTMEVYRDPVVSVSGNTYERAALAEHLAKVRCHMFCCGLSHSHRAAAAPLASC